MDIGSTSTISWCFLWLVALLSLKFSIFHVYSKSQVLCIPSEREALLKLKHDLEDPSDRLSSWVGEGDCCYWYGVVCNNLTGRVIELHLATSPPSYDAEMYHITFAEEEAYERSMFGGDINPSLLNLKDLSYLDLSGNDFGGNQIPTSIGSMSKLRYLDLSEAGFSGLIPHQIGNLSNLQHLNLRGDYHELFAEDLQWLSVERQWLQQFAPMQLRVSNGGRVRASLNAGLNVTEVPHQWYNLIADLPVKPPPPLHPKTHEPIKPEDLSPLFADELIKQESSIDRFIDIPDEVRDIYMLWRPTPLIRAKRLEKLLETPARIYYKYEGVSPAGSHKPNSAVPQAWYNVKQGVKNLVTETGAGQWGSALAFACSIFGLGCEVWQVRASYDQKPYRRLMMQTWGARVHSSPSDITEAGKKILQMDPSSPGSLGIAVSEAVEIAAKNADTKYCLGSVLNHVLLHQTVVGEECINQMEAIGETPDVIIGCTGGGSNFAGLSFPFIREKLNKKINPIIRAVEPTACPSLTKGVYMYDHGDTAGMTPLMKMHTLGHDFIPDPIHAGGLRYHGMAPLLSHIYELGYMEAIAIPQTECFQGAIKFARTEGLIPAPEPTHAIAATIREALQCRETGEGKVILTAMCGHGHFDLASYEKYLQGNMVDLSFSEDKMQASLANVPAVTA